MKKMKKIVKVSLLSLMGAGTLMAAPITKTMHIGVGAISMADETKSGFEIGVEKTKIFKNKFLSGFGAVLDYASFPSGGLWGLSSELKGGYQITNKASVYGLLGLKAQGNDGFDAVGFGFGGGTSYQAWDKVAIQVKYMNYGKMNINPEGDYKSESIMFGVNYSF